MKLLSICFLLLSFFSLHSLAITITDSRYDFKLPEGESVFDVDMLAHGFNPATDTVSSLDLRLVFREIFDDDATETYDEGTVEFVVFHTILFGARMTVDADVDTGIYSFANSWAPGESTCIFGGYDGEPCEWDPIGSGVFGLYVSAYTDNLWVNEATWTMKVTRTAIAEPTSIALFALGILMLATVRSRELGLK
ncbi:MAG TPA: hypothetical protein VLC79_15290 [Cellvibrio sp.]|nr:hypothetical protein [Cellvibrio sp.]